MKLFEPAQIGRLSLKNRVVMLPMMTRLNEPDGRLSQRAVDFYSVRAKGGAGLIIAAMWAVTREVDIAQGTHPGVFMADSRKYLKRLSKLADAVHDYGAKLAIQLTAGHGRVAWPYGLVRGAVAPSKQPCFYDPKITARQLTIEEIDRLVKGFGLSAKIASLAGIDAVEIHGHCGYLIDQFMTTIWNHRTDRYGGNLEGRLRFPLEIVESIKAGAGRDFPIIFRMSLKHNYKGGREVEESLEIARILEKAGVDAINANVGCYDAVKGLQYPTYDPPGSWINFSEAVKKAVRIPVIAVGKLGYPEIAEGILQEGRADFIGLGRALLADPEWPSKVKEGRQDDILMCIGCNECMRMIASSHAIGCAINPLAGREKELAITESEKKKSVLIVGGGPAGMEAARVAASKGNEVTLYEKGDKLGGNLIPVSVPDFKQDVRSLITYLSKQINKLGVKIEMGKEATPELIQRIKPEVLIIATGATPIIPEIPGIEKESVVMAFDVLSGKKEVGETIAVVGGGLVGCELASYLSQKGKKLTIVETGKTLLPDEFEFNRTDLLWVLKEGGVNLLTETQLVEITDDGLVISNNSGTCLLKADTVVLALGLKSEVRLLKALEGKAPEARPIGDCVVPRKRIKTVIWSGFHAARQI
jgi:2-enoate reductase